MTKVQSIKFEQFIFNLLTEKPNLQYLEIDNLSGMYCLGDFLVQLQKCIPVDRQLHFALSRSIKQTSMVCDEPCHFTEVGKYTSSKEDLECLTKKLESYRGFCNRHRDIEGTPSRLTIKITRR